MNKKISANNKRTWQDPIIRKKRSSGIHKAWHGDNTYQSIFLTKIKPLLYSGLTAIRMVDYVDLSAPTIKKIILAVGSNEDIKQLETNINYWKGEGGRSTAGKLSKLKGKTYEDIHGKERAVILSNQQRKWAKDNNWSPRRFVTKISKPQQMLYDILIQKYPDAILEQEFTVKRGRKIWVDIAIPSYKIVVEYDGKYWHDVNNRNSIWTDKRRDNFLKRKGWKVYRFIYENNPTNQELRRKATEYGIL